MITFAQEANEEPQAMNPAAQQHLNTGMVPNNPTKEA
jgi:hypothetical protein